MMVAPLLLASVALLITGIEADCQFVSFPRHALYGFNNIVLKHLQQWECQRKCESETSFSCQSFDYSSKTETCFLSRDSRVSQPSAYGKHASSDYFEKVCTDEQDPASGSGLYSDDEPCMRDWYGFQGSCYRFVMSNDKTWENAQHSCMANDSHLASVESLDEFNFLTTKIEETVDEQFDEVSREVWWIGGRKEGDTWVWDRGDGTYVPMEFRQWFPGEPNNMDDREVVINLLYRTGHPWGFNDGYPGARLRFICEYSN